MTQLYSLAGITKQALHKHLNWQLYKNQICQQVVATCTGIRKNHPRMSCRKMYQKVSNKMSIGRDLFEQIGFENGFKVNVLRNKFRTTWAAQVGIFPNLLEGVTLDNINQAIQSDIFYFPVAGKVKYGISNIDVYSRRMLSLHGSNSLQASQNVIALRKILKCRKKEQLAGCIHHSDKGVQYISEAFKLLIKELQMRPSMCKLPQENAYAERVQGTIKNEYLIGETLTENNYQRKLQKIMWLYNNERPHSSLGNRTPVAFEEYINTLPANMRPKLTVFKWENPLLTDLPVINKKKKEAKKKKSTSFTKQVYKSQPISG